jgi:hypothetical protein
MGNPLAELGIGGEDGKMNIEHGIMISTTKVLEGALLQTLVNLNKTSKDVNKVMKVVGYATATYLVLIGVARVIEASKKRSSFDDDN